MVVYNIQIDGKQHTTQGQSVETYRLVLVDSIRQTIRKITILSFGEKEMNKLNFTRNLVSSSLVTEISECQK